MRIVSKFNDYYDSALAYGVDMDTMYLRKADEFDMTLSPGREPLRELYGDAPWRISSNDVVATLFIIGFCGKIYPVFNLEYTYTSRTGAVPVNKMVKRSLYSIGDVIKAWGGKHLRKQAPQVIGLADPRKGRWLRHAWGSRREFNLKNLEKFFDAYHGSTEFEELFYEINSPIFIASETSGGVKIAKSPPHIEINCPLKPYQFYKVFDAYQAFQQVEMYITGVLRRGEPIMATISDTHMLQKKGFYKYSFKTRPTRDDTA